MTQIIDQLPLPVPSRTDPANFSVRADNFLGELPDFATQVNALATELTALGNTVEANKNTAVTAANNAQASAFAATGSANNAATSSGAALWVSGTTYSLGALVYSPITGRTYRRKIAGAGTTDPSADATNWIPIVLEISTQYPTIRPSLNLDFVNNKYLDPRITFTRSTIAKYYDGKTVHKAEENLLMMSEEFDNAAWTKINTTVTANTQVNPFGQSTSETLTETVASGNHWTYQLFGCTSGNIYTLSVYAKYSSRQFLQLALGSSGFNTTYYANFDVQNGTVGTVGSGVTAGIVSVGNGWYRCSITGVALTSSTTAGANVFMANSSSLAYGASYTGSTSNSVYIFGAQVEQRNFVGPYQSTTTQPITNYQSTLVNASINQPRFDHDPVTKECKGLFIEDATTNLLTYSEDFGNAAWTKNASTVLGDFTIAPDGTKSADKIIETAATAGHYTYQGLSVTASGSKRHSFSVYAKKAEKQYLQLIVAGVGLGIQDYANFDLQNGIVGDVGIGIDASIVSVGNGWYRCSMSFNPASSGTCDAHIWLINAANSSRAPSTTGNGYDGLFIWGAMLEDASASPSSYVATTGTTASRSYDNAVMTGSNFSSWYNQEEGSTCVEFKMNQPPLTGYYNNFIFSINDGSFNNKVSSSVDVANNLRNDVYYNNTTSAYMTSPFNWINQTPYRVVQSFKQDDFNSSFNSSTVVSDTSGVLFKGFTELHLGSQLLGSSLLRGHLRRFTYYPKKLTNQELQTLTSI